MGKSDVTLPKLYVPSDFLLYMLEKLAPACPMCNNHRAQI